MRLAARKLIKELVQTSILAEFDPITVPNKSMFIDAIPELNENGACFVTLTLDGQLRGCIGSLEAYRTLYDDLVYNAKAAAFSDLRFKPLSFFEFHKIDIEVSLLSPKTEIEYTDTEDLRTKIRPHVDGVVLTYDNKSATYLPQVWDDLPYFDDFFVSLAQKANLRPGVLESHPKIEIYQVEKF